MKSKTNSTDESCFNLPTGYSIDMSVTADILFEPATFLNKNAGNNWVSTIAWFANL